MWRLILSTVLSNRSRLLLTWAAVALGVAFVAGSLVLTDTSTRLLDAGFRRPVGFDLTVRSAAAFDSAMGIEVQRDPVPAGLEHRIAETAGVRRAQQVVSGAAQLRGNGPGADEGPAVVRSWASAPFAEYTLHSGHDPRGDEAVLDSASARMRHLEIGDVITLSAETSRRVRVVGTAQLAPGEASVGSSAVFVDLSTAQKMLGLGSGASSIEVQADRGVSIPDLRSRLARTLGERFAVSTVQDAAAASADAAEQRIGFIRLVLIALAAAGFVVGGLLIANTFTIVLAQRSRELALLRAAGATGRQVFASVLGEALVVGITGAAAGSAAGIGVAYGLRGLAAVAGLDLPTGPLTVTTSALASAAAAGVLVTLLAALAPARRAARVAPVEAMRSSDPAPVRQRRTSIVGWGLAGSGVAGVVTGAALHSIGGVALGAALLLAGLAVLGPVLTPRLTGVIGRPLHALGAPGRLARESAVRNPTRTNATTIALALGLTLISFVTVLGASVKAIAAGSGETVSAELMVESSGGEMLGGLSPEIRNRIDGLPEVAATSATRLGHWLDRGTADVLTAVDPATLPRVANVRLNAGSLAALDSGGVVIAADVARERQLHVGDTLPMTFPRDGAHRLRVVGVMAEDSAQALSASYVISLGSYARHYSENVDATVYVALARGVGTPEGRRVLKAAVADFPNAAILDQSQAAARRAAAVDQVLGLITVLLAFAVLIALLGITNTLALSIVERTREIGLLRAVGMTRTQLARMVRAEAVLIATVAVVVGTVLGVGLAAATVAGLASGNPFVLSVPVAQLLVLLSAAMLAGLSAGLVPAHRASRIDVLTAIATE